MHACVFFKVMAGQQYSVVKMCQCQWVTQKTRQMTVSPCGSSSLSLSPPPLTPPTLCFADAESSVHRLNPVCSSDRFSWKDRTGSMAGATLSVCLCLSECLYAIPEYFTVLVFWPHHKGVVANKIIYNLTVMHCYHVFPFHEIYVTQSNSNMIIFCHSIHFKQCL